MIKKNGQFIFFLTGSKILLTLLIVLLFAQCRKKEITIQEEKPTMVANGYLTKEIAIAYLNKYYPEYHADSLPWQYVYIKQFEDGSSVLKIVWKEDYKDPIFTDIILWTYKDSIYGALYEVYPDAEYLAEKKKWLGDGYPTRYYIYDDDFTGLIALGDLKTHQLIEGRIYQNGEIVQYMYPKNGNIQKGVQATIREQKQESEESILLDDINIYSSYGKGGGNISFGNVTLSNITVYSSYSNKGYSSGGGGYGGITGTYTATQSAQKQVQKTPCDFMKILAKGKPFQDMMKDLKEKLKEEIEYGYTYRQKGSSYETKLFTGTSENVQMSFPKNNPIDGWVHTHYEVNGMNATGYIFSLHDMWQMANFYNSGVIADANSFSIGVVTPKNTYILKIENITRFQAFAQKYKNEDNLIDKVKEGKDKYYFGSSLEDEYETNVLNFLSDFNTGMILYKTKTNEPNQNFDTWTSPQLSPWASPIGNKIINTHCF